MSADQIEAVVTAVETDVYDKFDAEVETRYLGELVMQHLRKLDQVAFVRFASVYREFKDVRDFVEELEPILAEIAAKRAVKCVRGPGVLGLDQRLPTPLNPQRRARLAAPLLARTNRRLSHAERRSGCFQ